MSTAERMERPRRRWWVVAIGVIVAAVGFLADIDDARTKFAEVAPYAVPFVCPVGVGLIAGSGIWLFASLASSVWPTVKTRRRRRREGQEAVRVQSTSHLLAEARALLRWTRGLPMTMAADGADDARAEIAIDGLRQCGLLPEGVEGVSASHQREILVAHLKRTIALLEAFGFEGARRELSKETKA